MKGIPIALAVLCIASSAWSQARDKQRLKREFDEIIRMLGAAHAIEAACPDYKITPQLEAALAALDKFGTRADAAKDMAARITLAMADMALKYGAERGPKEFCERILADHGPTSPNPVVVRK